MSHADTLVDFITGSIKANTGAEANRQVVEKLLVEAKGYDPQQIEVDAPICVEVGGEPYHASVDLVIRVQGMRLMVIKCAPGALASREREVVAAARLLDSYQVPLAVATDGNSAFVWETVSAKCIGEGLDAIPAKEAAIKAFHTFSFVPLEEQRRIRQQLIFKSYDSMNVHRSTDIT